MALPSVGGMVTILLTLFTVPVLYAWGEEWRMNRRVFARERSQPATTEGDAQ
jgi:hypothetical protein